MKTERILGALYGQALGDAMGMPSELWPRSRVKAHFGWIDRFLPGPKENNAACYFNRAEFTDDTSMALCLADALLERKGKIDPDLIGRNILDWALRFDAFNKNVLGPTSKIALNAIRDGKPVAELENNGVTNGAAMRVSPLGCLLPARDVDSFIDDVALASSPTHKSDLAVAGAVVIAWAIIVLNPAEPPLMMRDTVYVLSDEASQDDIEASINEMAEAVQAYVPGYRLKQRVQFEVIPQDKPVNLPGVGQFSGLKTAVWLEVEGAAHYLPAYAGNLDIMTSSALATAEKMAQSLARKAGEAA